MIELPPQSTRYRFGNAPPSASCTSKHARDAGGIKVATVTQVHDGTHKRIYNNHEDSTSQESKYTIQRSKSYKKTNSIRVRTRIQMGLRGLKITMASKPCPGQARRVTLLTSSLPYMWRSGQRLPKKEGERERKKKKNESEYRGTYSRDWNSAVLAYRLYGGLSGNKSTKLERHTTTFV
jgi:hypothetical protein